jgi:hypothetical protein
MSRIQDHSVRPLPRPVEPVDEMTATSVEPKMTVQAGRARWTVGRVVKYVDKRTGAVMVSAIGTDSSGVVFSFCKRANAPVDVVELPR